MRRELCVLSIIGLLCFAIYGCEKLLPAGPNENEILDGPVEGLSTEEMQRFLKGDRAFNDEIFTPETGLGPVFVATSCGSCHAGDGKGHPFTTLTRFGQSDNTGNKYLDKGGPQLQNRANPGYKPEVLPEGATFSKFTPPANTGLGYIELVPDEDIMAMSDPLDLDGDGISGTINWKDLPWSIKPHPGAVTQNGKYICRFGKKAGAYNLLHQTIGAYNEDMGVTSYWAPVDPYTGFDTDEEVSKQTVHDVVFYLQTLKAPISRNQDDLEVQNGKSVFMEIGCESCHRQTLKTGYSPVDALSRKEFHPYTDLLLHDMGAGLDDGYTEGSAKTSEWRTPALWGLGLSKNSQGGKYYLMHDGRAGSIEEAILLHGGESEKSKVNYEKLTESEKKSLIKFLESL